MEAPQVVFDVHEWYRSCDIYMQLILNVLLLFYLVFIQLFFLRYVLCDSCVREWNKLN